MKALRAQASALAPLLAEAEEGRIRGIEVRVCRRTLDPEGETVRRGQDRAFRIHARWGDRSVCLWLLDGPGLEAQARVWLGAVAPASPLPAAPVAGLPPARRPGLGSSWHAAVGRVASALPDGVFDVCLVEEEVDEVEWDLGGASSSRRRSRRWVEVAAPGADGPLGWAWIVDRPEDIARAAARAARHARWDREARRGTPGEGLARLGPVAVGAALATELDSGGLGLRPLPAVTEASPLGAEGIELGVAAGRATGARPAVDVAHLQHHRMDAHLFTAWAVTAGPRSRRVRLEVSVAALKAALADPASRGRRRIGMVCGGVTVRCPALWVEGARWTAD